MIIISYDIIIRTITPALPFCNLNIIIGSLSLNSITLSLCFFCNLIFVSKSLF